MKIRSVIRGRFWDKQYDEGQILQIDDPKEAEVMLALEYQISADIIHPFVLVDEAGEVAQTQAPSAEGDDAENLQKLTLEELRKLAKERGLDYKGKNAATLIAELSGK